MKKNLPAIILLVQTQGKLVLDAANQVVTTGKVVADEVTSLGGKAISCAGKAVQADADASASLNVSVQASASVSGSCGGPDELLVAEDPDTTTGRAPRLGGAPVFVGACAVRVAGARLEGGTTRATT